MTKIKNIIFDLGGVLLNIDFNKTKQAFEKLGVNDFDSFYTKESANPVFEALETGHISNEEFYAALQKHCRPGTSFFQIQDAWNEILLDFRRESIAALDELKKRYDIYLLSNTNRIHHAEFSARFKNDFDGRVFDSFFIKAYYSQFMQRRKPYKETYLYVVGDAGINAAETLFIDDALANIEGAAKAGLQTKLLGANEKIEDLGL
jgi:glucose-1-phosphatase